MVYGLIIAIIGGLTGLIGSLSVEWVDSDVVRFNEAAMYYGTEWWTGIVVVVGFVLALVAAVVGLFVVRRKLFALSGLAITVVSLVFLVLTPFLIRNDIIEMVNMKAIHEATTLAMFYGFHLAFLGISILCVGFIWTLGAQPILGPDDRLLRVALLWKGTLIKEDTFTDKRDITIGDGVNSDFVVPAGSKVGHSYPLVSVDRKGNYSLGLKRGMMGRVSLGGNVEVIDDYVKKHTSDQSGANYVPIQKGDWGVLEFGDVEMFIQFVRPDVIIGHQSTRQMDGNIVAAILGALFVVASFFVVSQFLWNPAGNIEKRKADKRELKVDADITQEKDEDLLEIGEEDDTTGKKAEGEEGKFGDPDKDPTLESKVPKRDGEMVNRIDPKKIGLADLLSNKMSKSEAISSILSDNADAFDNRMAVAMAGTGAELSVGYGAGGMGFKGTGPGGGGTGGYGRIHGLGRVDTGGGMGVRAGLGRKGSKKVGKVKLGGMSGTGFCKKGQIRSVVLRRAGAIRACYEAQLQIHDSLAGKITARWTINMEGRVDGASMVSSTLGNTSVEQCILRTLRRMRFEKPEGGVCVVQWPFVFNPG